ALVGGATRGDGAGEDRKGERKESAFHGCPSCCYRRRLRGGGDGRGVRRRTQPAPASRLLGAQNGRGRPRHGVRRATKFLWVCPASPSVQQTPVSALTS